MTSGPEDDSVVRCSFTCCSFCGKSQRQVRIIGGPARGEGSEMGKACEAARIHTA
ncbi:MAG: hypothetical protein DLM70_10670 [Chloroflexi bacterium]|nr:MAG: hypothetical protein DLM70_10670 [Chloroflexota bacterium]